jgi:excisionase family DNA binding protein
MKAINKTIEKYIAKREDYAIVIVEEEDIRQDHPDYTSWQEYDGPAEIGEVFGEGGQLSTKEAARLTGRAMNSIRDNIRRGAIAARKVGRDWLIPNEEIIKFYFYDGSYVEDENI